MLAGLGTRCYPFAYSVPKCMMPVYNKPVIQYIVEEMQACGIENIYFVLPNFCDCKVVLRHFQNQKGILEVLKQKNSPYFFQLQNRKFPKITAVYCAANGSGGAILACKKYLLKKHFVVANGDDIFFGQSVSKQIVSIANQNNCCVISSMPVDVSQNFRYGMIDCDDNMIVKNIIEKPQNNKLLTQAVIGRYVLDDNIFDVLKSTPKVNGEIYLTTAVGMLAKKQKVLCCPIDAKRFDCGCFDGVLKANLQFCNQK